jgi:hypothetical protein
MVEQYRPEELLLEAPKKMEEDPNLLSKAGIKTDSTINEIKRLDPRTQVVEPVRQTVPVSGSVITPQGRPIYQENKTDFERTKDRFAEIRKKAYAEVEKELSETQDSQKYASVNPHLKYIKGKKAKPIFSKVKKIFSKDIIKQILAVAGIVGLQTVISMLKEEYKSTLEKK